VGGRQAQKGEIDYPEYMKATHADWLASTDTACTDADRLLGVSVTTTMSRSLGASPYTTLTAYDPDGNISNVLSALSVFGVVDIEAYLATLTGKVSLDKFVLPESQLVTEEEKYQDLLNGQLDSVVLPRYAQGQGSINAIMSEAYVRGTVLLRNNVVEESAKFKTDLQELGMLERSRLIPLAYEIAMKVVQMKLEYSKAVMSFTLQVAAVSIIAKKEELEQLLDIEEQDHLWDLEVYQYGSSVMAAIRGAVVQDTPKPNKLLSAAMGAVSGALMGAEIGSAIPVIGTVIGAIIGAIIGGIAGYLS
jgi:hypothetical protein